MNDESRYVFDNSAIVSAALFEDSVPNQAFRSALDDGSVLASAETLSELRNVLMREKFDKYLTREERDQFLLMFIEEAMIVEITEEIRACRDKNDDKFLELSVSGGAACLVTSDNDLLVLHPFRGIPILTPSLFIAWLAEAEN